MIISFSCDNCGKQSSEQAIYYKRKKRHFCSRQCYSSFRREKLPKEEQNAWQGGVTPEESRRRWYLANRKKAMAAAKARKLRELNAPGSHTKEEWEAHKKAHNYECAMKDDTCKGNITKDHTIPLIMGGSQNIDNLQILCHSHNSRKQRQVYVGNFVV